MKNIYSISILLCVLNHSCVDKNKSNTMLDFTPSIRSVEDKIQYSISIYNTDTLVLEVLVENWIIGDGFEHQDSVFMYPEVYLGNRLIYSSTDRSIFHLKRNDIKTVNEGKNICYTLLRKSDIPYADKYLIIGVNEEGVTSLIALSKYCEDIDNDGFIEVGGFSLIEGYYESDSGYYSPARIYELSDSIVFDSITSKTLTLDRYEEFLGFEMLYVPVKLNAQYIKQLTTQ